MAKKATELKFENFISISGREYVSADSMTPEQNDEIMTKLLDDIMSADGYVCIKKRRAQF